MYIFEAIYNNDSTITVKSNTFWSCKVEGNFMLSAYDGLANEEGVDIDIIVPNEIEIIEGTVTFTYGDDRCKYPEIYVYQINNCILETTPGFIESNGRKEIYFPNKNEGDTISIKVKTAYNSLASWTYEKIGTNSNVFTNDSEMFIVVGSEQGEIKISNQYCDDSIYIVMCTSEGYVCEYTLYTDATIVDWYFGSTKYTSTRVFRGMAKCSRTFYDGEQMQSVTAKPKKGDHVYEDVIIACGESKESYCQTTIATEGEYSCHDGGTITFIIDKCDDGPTCEENVEYQYGVGSLTLGACDTEGNARIPYTSTTTYIDCTTKTSTGNKTVHVTGFTKNEGDPIRNRSYTFTSDGVQYTILYNQGGHCTPPPTPVSTSITWNNATVAAGKCDISKTVTITGTKVTVYSDGSETRTSTSTTQTYSIEKNETSSPKVYTFTYNGATITINQEAGPCTTPPIEDTYFTIESQANSNRISIRFDDESDGSEAITISASTDNGATWSEFTSTTGGTTLATLGNGQKLQLKGNLTRTFKNRLLGSGDFKVYGRLTSLTNEQTNTSGFTGLFSGSTNLTSASGLLLTSTTSPNYCYYHMFDGCSKLVDAPALPATAIGERCYASMFSGCTSLVVAPELPATNLSNAPQCYFNMFYNCSGLTTAPSSLPATALSVGCYGYMFRSCSSLTTVPSILPATALTSSCYQYMFAGCRSLATAPELPASTLAVYCYDRMFLDCSGLSNIKCLATNISASNCTTRWVANIASSGTFTKAPNMCDWSRGVNGIPEGWYVIPDDCGDEPTINYFAITSRANNNVIKLIAPDANSSVTVSVSTDNGENWNTFESTTEGITVATLNNGQTALFKGSNETMKRNHFSSTGQFDVSGDILTLTNGNMATSGFAGLFSATSVVSAEHLVLSSTTLTRYCYSRMFENCASLSVAPELPATTLANWCYWSMFDGCTNLTTAPELPSTTLDNGCYSNIFYGCTSLTTAPELPATTLKERCYDGMFYGCTSLTTAPKLPATTLANYCYQSMFDGCINLTTAPELSATTLAFSCYSNMFYGCTGLTTAPDLPATTLSDYCYYFMFQDCTSLTVAPELPATTLTVCCYDNMFYGCTNLTTAPELPAAVLTRQCYRGMFGYCTKINSITCLATDISATECTYFWLEGVAENGTFHKAVGMCDWEIGYEGIPNGWNMVPDDCGGGEPEYCEPIMDGDTGTPSIKLKWVGIDTNGTFYTDYLNTKDKWIYASGSLSMIAHVELNNSGGIGAAGQSLCKISTVERYCVIVMRTTDYDTWPGGTTSNDSPTNTGSVYTLNDSTKKQTFNLYSRTDEDNQLLLRDYMVSKAIRIPCSGYKGKTQFYCYPYTFSSSMFAVEQSVSYLTRDEEHSVISGKNAVNGSLSENGFTMHYENTNNSSLEYELSYEIAPNTTCSYKEHIVKLGRGVQEGKNYSGSTTEGGASVAAIHFLQEYKTKNRVYYGNGFTQKKYDDNYNQTSSDLYQYHMFFETCSSHVLVEDEKTFGVASYVAYPLTDDFEYDVSMEMGEMVIEKDNYMWGDTPMRIVKSGAYYRVKFTKKQ